MQDLAQCNDFDKFATLTFDPKKHPRCREVEYTDKKIIHWLNNQQKRYGAFRYIVAKEPMKDGKIHYHMVLGGFTGHYHKTNIRKNGRQAYKIDSWEKSNGFADMEDIGNKEASIMYLMKYLQKELSSSIHVKGSRRYFASKGLRRPEKTYGIEEDQIASKFRTDKAPSDEFENDYVQISVFDKL